jgi:hypothetical protein
MSTVDLQHCYQTDTAMPTMLRHQQLLYVCKIRKNEKEYKQFKLSQLKQCNTFTIQDKLPTLGAGRNLNLLRSDQRGPAVPPTEWKEGYFTKDNEACI